MPCLTHNPRDNIYTHTDTRRLNKKAIVLLAQHPVGYYVGKQEQEELVPRNDRRWFMDNLSYLSACLGELTLVLWMTVTVGARKRREGGKGEPFWLHRKRVSLELWCFNEYDRTILLEHCFSSNANADRRSAQLVISINHTICVPACRREVAKYSCIFFSAAFTFCAS